jgi:hypothetical protein
VLNTPSDFVLPVRALFDAWAMAAERFVRRCCLSEGIVPMSLLGAPGTAGVELGVGHWFGLRTTLSAPALTIALSVGHRSDFSGASQRIDAGDLTLKFNAFSTKVQNVSP